VIVFQKIVRIFYRKDDLHQTVSKIQICVTILL